MVPPKVTGRPTSGGGPTGCESWPLPTARRPAPTSTAFLYEPWGFAVEDVDVPIHAWHGDADQGAPLALVQLGRRETGDTNGTLTVYPGEGHYLDGRPPPRNARVPHRLELTYGAHDATSPRSNRRRRAVHATQGHQHELVDMGRPPSRLVPWTVRLSCRGRPVIGSRGSWMMDSQTPGRRAANFRTHHESLVKVLDGSGGWQS